jgi:hypothetical protein
MSAFKRLRQRIEVDVDGNKRSCSIEVNVVAKGFSVTVQRMKSNDPEGNSGLMSGGNAPNAQLDSYEEPRTFTSKAEALNYVTTQVQSFLYQQLLKL